MQNINFIEQECIPIRCVPPAGWAYPVVSEGGLPNPTPPVDRKNDTRLWKYYLAPNLVCER